MIRNLRGGKSRLKHLAWWWRRVPFPILLALLAVGFIGTSTALASRSAPLRPETISSQTAAAGPAIVAHTGTTAYVGWTGTNAAHNLNLMTYTTTTNSFGPAHVLTDTTPAGSGPSLAMFNGNLYVSWRGTTNNRLNVARFNPANPTHLAGKVTLSETSFNAPSIAPFNGRLYLSWRGTDGSLNIISSADATTFNTKVTYNIQVRTSPTLVNTPNFLEVGWENTSASSNIVIAQYDTANPATLKVVVTTTSSSQLPVGLDSFGTAGPPTLEVIWRTPSDARIRLGLFSGTPVISSIVTTTQTTPYGPTVSVPLSLMCWTGSDARHHVNVISESL